ncbi:MAG TPA: peptide deformylase [Opitutaceae bacterium]|nr:peptide deformylase [Opitutaceae bacterium]
MPSPIVHFNDPVLRKKGAKVTVFDAALRRLAEDMVETMHAAEGIGLAAQQIGRAIQLCVVDLRPADSEFDWEFDGAHPPLELFMPLTLVNPEIAPVPDPETVYEEGCLSFPGIRGDVTRPDEITVKFQDAAGVPHALRCNGLLARCIQHEADHLNGVLFIDRMDKETLAALEPELKALKKRTREAAKA